jgi:hypothetical protein
MNDSRVHLQLDGDRTAYRGGDTLTATYSLRNEGSEELQGVEVSVLWYTEGKGDEDIGVHFFEKLAPEEGEYLDPAQVRRIVAVLPRSPLSYDGFLLKIHWAVRVRAFWKNGSEDVAEAAFQLGNVTPAPETLA